ncbi:hypothetical protein HELRODRAFT_177162 [Helobdella robusta]|uniref:Uncharacterized protein n=1 Tax=Helobdella robusta TaxID=6412 RepID=T1FBA7_HELRO|nr:hypothetical protein HELRODRAFT_177162 [Helobdella robusta]ESN98280.1 hypothetical protein HELRODRAFT_177162 [Helobdella robusta]
MTFSCARIISIRKGCSSETNEETSAQFSIGQSPIFSLTHISGHMITCGHAQQMNPESLVNFEMFFSENENLSSKFLQNLIQPTCDLTEINAENVFEVNEYSYDEKYDDHSNEDEYSDEYY